MPRRQQIKATVVRGPRRYLRHPDQFGITQDPQPAALPTLQEHLADAALPQHELARQAIEQMTRLGLVHNEIADQLGISGEQLRRQLRGESAMTLERMHHLAQAVGLKIKIEIERTE